MHTHEQECALADTHRDTLEADVAKGRLAYIYTNGFVLPNDPHIKGGILANDGALRVSDWLERREGKPPGKWHTAIGTIFHGSARKSGA